jgi:hypothetical protein
MFTTLLLIQFSLLLRLALVMRRSLLGLVLRAGLILVLSSLRLVLFSQLGSLQDGNSVLMISSAFAPVVSRSAEVKGGSTFHAAHWPLPLPSLFVSCLISVMTGQGKY